MSQPVSVIVPVVARGEPLPEFYREYVAPLRAAGHPVEFLFIVPVTRFPQADALEQLRDAGEPIRVLRVAQPTGSGMLVRVGAMEATHDTMIDPSATCMRSWARGSPPCGMNEPRRPHWLKPWWKG